MNWLKTFFLNGLLVYTSSSQLFAGSCFGLGWPGKALSPHSQDSIANKGCTFDVKPDIPLQKSISQIEEEIQIIFQRSSDSYLGLVPPSVEQMAYALASYDSLQIVVSRNQIAGRSPIGFEHASFLITFARFLKFNPNDEEIRQKAVNVVWLVSTQFCEGQIATSGATSYWYPKFAKPAIFLQSILPRDIQRLFEYSLYSVTNGFQHFWEPDYSYKYQRKHGAISTDLISNLSDILLVYASWHDSAEERLRYMMAYQRYLQRFMSYSFGTADGLKSDGTGFHHWAAYDGYMHAYGTVARVLQLLDGTSFQVDRESYLRLRDAVYTQFVVSNDSLVRPLSWSGRKPDLRRATTKMAIVDNGEPKPIAIEGQTVTNRKIRTNRYLAFDLAQSGKTILKISEPDSILVKVHKYLFGLDSALINSFANGFFQFNYASSGVYRRSNWLAVSKGFTDGTWGAEIYSTTNRYGRYQSYGTLEIIYPGDELSGNGFTVVNWNWNFNPGATTVVLPWEKLQAERERIDEHQQKNFAGALSLQNKGSEVLSRTHGTYGIFAMDFQEKRDQGFGQTLAPNSHNDSFRFKKSNYFIDDMIVCLGSGISNNDSINNTVTTLYQRRVIDKNNTVVLNGAKLNQEGAKQLKLDQGQWVIDHFNTGYYVFPGNGSLGINFGMQQSPDHTGLTPFLAADSTATPFSIGYIDHGYAPENGQYEFVCVPGSNPLLMQKLADAFAADETKPYIIHQQDERAHVVEFKKNQIWAYSLFKENSGSDINGLIYSNSRPCLIMYKQGEGGEILLSVANPNLGLKRRRYTATSETDIVLELKGVWKTAHQSANVTITQSNEDITTLKIKTKDGLPVEIVLHK